jgi:two-component system OmpR family response regulator
MKILIIEDDNKISSLLFKGFVDSNFSVETALDGEIGLAMAMTSAFDLIILDLMLPKLDGVQILKTLRNIGSKVPILILSAKETVEDIVTGLQSGADDYLVKPFSFNELLARVNSLIRRTSTGLSNSILEYEDLKMNLLTREVKRNGINFDLHVNEFMLLEYMLQNLDIVLNKTQILKKVWGYDFDPQTNVVDVLVCRLRNKIDKDFETKIIQTVRGIGYVIKKG